MTPLLHALRARFGFQAAPAGRQRRAVSHRAGAPAGWLAAAALLLGGAASAQTFPHLPVSAEQRGTAQQVAQAGVALSELAPDAPERYTVQRSDTLWRISGIFLRHPWRWPELWGMNKDQVRNPHLIFPGQVLVLHRVGDRAFLSEQAQVSAEVPTVKWSPRIRAQSLADAAIPPIPLNVIEPYLTESRVVDAEAHARAPRIVATREGRVLLSRGDRAYARGQYGSAPSLEGLALSTAAGRDLVLRVYRNAEPLIDPASSEILAHQAQFIGKAQLLRGETLRASASAVGAAALVEPATIHILEANAEIRVGDRLLPEPEAAFPVFVPRAPATAQSGQIIKAYGNAVRFSGQNQVVVLNRGLQHGLERGHVLAILNDAGVVTDPTDAARTPLQLPDERNGLMMVFRTFDRVSYALVLHITDGVQVGDRFVNP